MKIKLSAAALVLGACLLPVAIYAADTAKSGAPTNTNETPGETIKDNGRADPAHRSVHPVDDSVITTKVKAKIVEDKRTRADHVDVETVNGVVDLTGTARSKASAARHVTLARQVKGVKSVKNHIQIEPVVNAAAADQKADQPRTAAKHGSNHPVKDTEITTKVKAKLLEDKTISSTKIHVKTVNGVVTLTGDTKTADESSKAEEIARGVEHVKSVTNNLKVM